MPSKNGVHTHDPRLLAITREFVANPDRPRDGYMQLSCMFFLHRVLDYRLYWETVGWVGIVIGLFCCCKRSPLQPNKIKLHEKEPLLGPPLPKVAGVRRLHKKFFHPHPLPEKNVTTTTDERRRKRRRRKALITVISCCFLAGEEVVAAFSTKFEFQISRLSPHRLAGNSVGFFLENAFLKLGESLSPKGGGRSRSDKKMNGKKEEAKRRGSKFMIF